jgi:hypothetical protein
MAPSRKIAELFVELRAASSALPNDLNRAEREFGRFTKFIEENPTVALAGLSAAAGAAFVGIATKATLMASEVDTQMRRVVSALDLTSEQAKQSRADLAGFAVEFGQSQLEIARVMKTVADNGPASAAGLQAMTRAALDLAAVTGGDANSIAKGLDGVLDAFGRSNDEAVQVAASVFAITKGKIPLEDLFATIDKIGASAHAAGLSLEDIVGAATAMRDANIPVKQIRTELEALIAAGDNGVQKLHALAGGARDAAKDHATLDKALKDNAESAERLAASVREQLNNSLQTLGTSILPHAIDGLKDINAVLAAIEGRDFSKAGASLAEAIAKLPTLSLATLPLRMAIRAGGAAASAFDFAYPSAAQSAAGGQPISALLAGETSGGGAAGGGSSDAVAHHVQEIVRATKDLQRLAAPQIEAFIAELHKLDTPDLIKSNTPLSIEITKLVTALQNELPNAAERSSAAAKKATGDLAAFVAQAASITAHAAGDQLKEIDAQLLKLTNDATKAKALGTPEFASARSALEQQKTDLESARRVAEEEEQRANRIRQQAEDDRVFTEGALAITESRISDVLASAEAVHLGLVGLTDDQVQALIEEEDELTRVLKLEGLNNDERERATKLLVKIRGLLQGTVGENGDPTPKPAKAKDWADQLVRGARALLESAQAAGLLDQRMAAVVNSAVTFADSLSQAIASKGANVGADITAIASLINVTKGLFGKSDADRQRVRVEEENTRAVQALTQRVGDLSTLSVSGKTFGLAERVVGSIVSQTSSAKGSAKIKNVGDVLTATGLSADDLTSIARALGITIDGTVDSYRKLDEAMKAADAKAFADSWAGALQEFDTLVQVDGVNDPLSKLKLYTQTALQKSGSTLIDNFLESADFDTSEGRAKLRDAGRKIIQQLIDGTIDYKDFGNLNESEVLQFFETLIGDIDDVGQAASTTAVSATQAASALDLLNSSLSDIALVGDLVGHSADEMYQALTAATKAFPEFADQIASLAKGVDFNTAEGQAQFRANIKDLVQGIIAKYGITELTRPFLQFLDNLLHTLPPLSDAMMTATTSTDGLTQSVNEYAAAAETLGAEAQRRRLAGSERRGVDRPDAGADRGEDRETVQREPRYQRPLWQDRRLNHRISRRRRSTRLTS